MPVTVIWGFEDGGKAELFQVGGCGEGEGIARARDPFVEVGSDQLTSLVDGFIDVVEDQAQAERTFFGDAVILAVVGQGRRNSTSRP